MVLSDFIPAFKRYALYEKNLTANYIKGLLKTVVLLERQTDNLPMKKYDTETIASFLYQMKEERLWSAKTLRNYRQNLATYFNFLVQKGHIKTNPIDGIAKPKLPKTLPRCLDKKQVKRLISEVHAYRWSTPLEKWRNPAIIFTFLYTGIRMSELLNLKTDHVNFSERFIFIENGKGKKDRYVPLHQKLIPMLKLYQVKREERIEPSLFFFTSTRSSKRLTVANLHAIFKKLSHTSDFRVTPHMLRHTMAKLSLEANLNPYTLKEILGHSNIATTQIYMSISTEVINRSFSKLNLL